MTRSLSFLIMISGFLLSANTALSQGVFCKPNLIGDDICKRATEIADETSKLLPMKTGDGTILTEIWARDVTVNVAGVWELTSAQVKESIEKSGMTFSEFKAKGAESTLKMACSANVLASFVRLGGEIRYTYYTADQLRIFEALVVHCD